MGELSRFARERLLARNALSRRLFAAEAPRLAEASQRLAERFEEGGRLLAFGRGASATDAQHVSVEFVHPVIVGKRALPALDLSPAFGPWLEVLARPADAAIGFGPPAGDPEVAAALAAARRRGLLTFALPGGPADYGLSAPSPDPFVAQEMAEVLYHTLWETVHVFLEHRRLDTGAGAAGFLYPFLGGGEGGAERDPAALLPEVASSILAKAAEDERLREEAAGDADLIASAAESIAGRVRRGGKLIVFGNGGSATDANDLTIDCVAPPPGLRPLPAVSLSAEPANLSAIANDVGAEAMFLRQLIPHAAPHDVAVAITTSGGSPSVLAALGEARKRGLLTVALVGYDGGELVRQGHADLALVVRSDFVPRIQEAQASIYHVLREALERAL